VALVAGEPGIGKTRLTEEFCNHASSGATVIRGNCYEGDVAAPFGPWMEALRSLIEQTSDADLRETLGPGAPDIAAMLPELRRRLPDLEEAPRLEPEAERARLFDSINAWLRSAAERKPLVIFLDDLHWCDRPSLALLEQVARGAANQRVVIVGTYRDVEVDRVHPLAQTLSALRRMEHHERIGLKGFSVDSVLGLLNAIEPDEATEPLRRAVAQALHDACEGNPFFIREVLNNLVETGKLAQQDGVWVGTVGSIEELGIPEGIKEVIGRRLSCVSEICNRMLGRASAMTGGFTWDELQAICDDDHDALLDALDEALASQLIEERERNTYAFTHALIRATLYDELSTPRRVQLHRRIAESLETLYVDSIDDHLGELAAHFMASTGNAAEKAVEYSVRAGDRAREFFAWEEATVHYQRALDAMNLANGIDEVHQGEVLLALADCHHHAGDTRAADRALRSAAEIARRTGNAAQLALAAIGLEDAAYNTEGQDWTEVLALIDQALELIGAQASTLRVQLLCRRVRAVAALGGAAASGFTGSWAGDKDALLVAQAREALELAEQLEDDETLWVACAMLMYYSHSPDNLQERQEVLNRGYAAANRSGPLASPGEHLIIQASVLMELGDIASFRELIPQLASVQARYRFVPNEFMTLALAATLETAEGNLDAAEQTLERLALVVRNPDGAAARIAQLLSLRRMQGRFIELETVALAIIEQLPGVPSYRATLALMYSHAGRSDDAVAVIEEVLKGGVSSIPRDFLWMGTINLLADACVDVEHRSAAQALYEELGSTASGNAGFLQIVALGSMARVAGRLASLLERYDEAEQHFEHALRENDRMGFHAWTAWTRLDYGEMLIRRDRAGDRERAVVLLQQAHDFAKESGMGKVERDSERLLASLA
jgi:tetratricopeptide (TPR) repeat protein